MTRWQRDKTVFDFLAAQTGGGATLTGVCEPLQLRGARVSADYFRISTVGLVAERSLRTSTTSGRAERCPNPASLVRREEQSALSGKLHVQHCLHDA